MLQQLMIVLLFYLYFQLHALAQFQATRALSGHSVPIIVFIAAGAGAIIRDYGPESLGGRRDIGAKIDAEVARTGLSADEIGPKVHVSHRASKLTRRSCIQRYITIQKGNSFGFLAFLQCMTTNFFRRRYGLFELTVSILKWNL